MCVCVCALWPNASHRMLPLPVVATHWHRWAATTAPPSAQTARSTTPPAGSPGRGTAAAGTTGCCGPTWRRQIAGAPPTRTCARRPPSRTCCVGRWAARGGTRRGRRRRRPSAAGGRQAMGRGAARTSARAALQRASSDGWSRAITEDWVE